RGLAHPGQKLLLGKNGDGGAALPLQRPRLLQHERQPPVFAERPAFLADHQHRGLAVDRRDLHRLRPALRGLSTAYNRMVRENRWRSGMVTPTASVAENNAVGW